jgi:hypothetical protein
MVMGSKEGMQYIRPEGEIYACPVCRYTDGFHVSFNINKETDSGEIVLICPSCHHRFNLGWNVRLNGN